MGITFKVTDNSKQVLQAFDEQKKNGLWAIGAAAEGYAKDLTPVDTGRLRNSITHAEDGDSVYIGTNVEYAPGIEFGTHRKKGAAHMLSSAAQNHSEEYKKILRTALQK